MNAPSLRGIDYLEIYAFNALQAANFYRAAFGFNIVAYGGPKTGLKDKISYLLRQGSISLLISSAIDKDSSILAHIINHDESVKDIAFASSNVSKTYEAAIRAGAKSILEPTEIYDGKNRILKATIATFGSTVHSFIEREDSSSFTLPFYTSLSSPTHSQTGLENIDHIAVAIETGSLEDQKKFYENVLGFHAFYADETYTDDSGMKSVVVSDITESLKFVLVEGVSNKKSSQIENYISSYGCAGVQHIAFASNDIIKAASLIQNQGIKFLEVPETYYEKLPSALKKTLQEKIKTIKDLNILVDQEQQGYLMQIFTRPLQNRPTFFLEIIQRENSTGFGSGNIKALYKAVEQDQQKGRINV